MVVPDSGIPSFSFTFESKLLRRTYMKKNIALLAGGYSGEYVISIQTAETIEKNLDSEKYNIYKIIVTHEDWYYEANDGTRISVDKNDFTLTIDAEKVTFD